MYVSTEGKIPPSPHCARAVRPILMMGNATCTQVSLVVMATTTQHCVQSHTHKRKLRITYMRDKEMSEQSLPCILYTDIVYPIQSYMRNSNINSYIDISDPRFVRVSETRSAYIDISDAGFVSVSWHEVYRYILPRGRMRIKNTKLRSAYNEQTRSLPRNPDANFLKQQLIKQCIRKPNCCPSH